MFNRIRNIMQNKISSNFSTLNSGILTILFDKRIKQKFYFLKAQPIKKSMKNSDIKYKSLLSATKCSIKMDNPCNVNAALLCSHAVTTFKCQNLVTDDHQILKQQVHLLDHRISFGAVLVFNESLAIPKQKVFQIYCSKLIQEKEKVDIENDLGAHA